METDQSIMMSRAAGEGQQQQPHSHHCKCSPAVIETYARVEEETVSRLMPDSLLYHIDQAHSCCSKLLTCKRCTQDTFCLAVVCTLGHRVITLAKAYCRSTSTPDGALHTVRRRNPVFLDDYELKTSESTLLVTRLLLTRMQRFDEAVVTPTARCVEELFCEQHDPYAKKTLEACKRAVGEMVDGMGNVKTVLEGQLKEVKDSGME